MNGPFVWEGSDIKLSGTKWTIEKEKKKRKRKKKGLELPDPKLSLNKQKWLLTLPYTYCYVRDCVFCCWGNQVWLLLIMCLHVPRALRFVSYIYMGMFSPNVPSKESGTDSPCLSPEWLGPLLLPLLAMRNICVCVLSEGIMSSIKKKHSVPVSSDWEIKCTSPCGRRECSTL